jgi:tetratricopeptide (TPR) repeat protein
MVLPRERGKIVTRKATFSVTSRSLVLLSLAALLCVPAFAEAQLSPVDEAIAVGYLRQAEQLFRTGDGSRAMRLLERSLEFYPGFSESLYLQARIYMQRQDTLHVARSALELALANDRWRSTPPREAQMELARIDVWSRRYETAESLLRSLGADRGLGGTGSADLAELWARTLIGRGRLSEAEVQLERALQRYPDDPALYVLTGDLLAQRRKSRKAAELLDRGLGELPGSSPLLFARARVEGDRERRLELLERHFAEGGGDPAAAALMLIELLSSAAGQPRAAGERLEPGAGSEFPDQVGDQPGLSNRAHRALDLFFELGGERQVRLIDRLRDFLIERSAADGNGSEPPAYSPLYAELLGRVDASVAGYSGDRIVDDDGDGLYEELYRYRDGQLELWLVDENQDGLPEARIQYRKSEPDRIAFPSGEAAENSVEYVYSRYPYLKQLVYLSGGSRRVYELIPFRYTFQALRPVTVEAPIAEIAPSMAVPVASAGSTAGAGEIPSPGAGHPLGRQLVLFRLLSEVDARSRSSRMVEYLSTRSADGDAAADRVYTLLNSETVRIDQDPDREGRYRRYVLFADGRPVSGRRDLDGDGVFETSEQYAVGLLRSLVLDQDGDGNPEFTELFEAGEPERSEKRWDYNSDGRFDSRQFVLLDGSVVREFSSRLDGRFDLRAVFRNGRLDEFRRGGRLLTIRYEPDRDLYRIGPIEVSTELPGPLTEGIHRRGGSRLFVFDYQGKTYIGELE